MRLKLHVDIKTICAVPIEELRWLVAWAAMKRADVPHFTAWLQYELTLAMECRLNEAFEVGMIVLPEMDADRLQDFMLGAYVLSRLPLTEAQAALVDQISYLVNVEAMAAIDQYCRGTDE